MLDILSQRLFNQLLSKDLPSANPYSVVKHMTCMQAQDRNQHLWAIASRSNGKVSAQDICHAYNDGLMVRTRTQRGTLHVVAVEDAGRMVRLCASKTLSGFQRRRDFLGISDTILEQAMVGIQNSLQHGPLTRGEIVEQLKQSGIPMQSGRGYHILCYMGTLGLTVQGPIKDREQAFVLSSQWIKDPKILTEDESLAELTFRYFSSHGPATIADFQWWSGLGVGMIKKGIAINEEKLLCKDGLVGHPQSWDTNHTGHATSVSLQSVVHFLAGFDEFLLGYKDRTATLDLAHHTLVDVSRNGVFKPTVMIDGKTAATRSTKLKKDFCEILVKSFFSLSPGELIMIEKASQKYGEYLEKQVRVTML